MATAYPHPNRAHIRTGPASWQFSMTYRPVRHLLAAAVFLLFGTSYGQADTFTIAVQPVQSAKTTKTLYTPLVDYLNQGSRHTFKLKTAPNFFVYWQEMKKGSYDIILDDAHLTDYRAQKLGYSVIARVLDVTSFTLVTAEDLFVFTPDELAGKRVASLASPSRGALTMDALFNNPIRQPILIEVSSTQDAVQKILDKKADGAMIPTSLIGHFPQLNVISTTTQWPRMGLSVSGRVPVDVSHHIQTLLVSASDNTAGQSLLKAINLPGFEKADAGLYAGYADILQNFWDF